MFASWNMAVFKRRAATVEDVQFSSGLRQRFAHVRPDVTRDGLQVVEAGAQQWFRMGGRHPKAKLTVPSVVVGDFVREFALQNQGTAPSVAERGRLAETFRLAREDEKGAVLPLLFRVDRELSVAGGWNYLADCGGRGVCYELKDTVCLQHLRGPGRRPGGGGWQIPRDNEIVRSDGGGCGCGDG